MRSNAFLLFTLSLVLACAGCGQKLYEYPLRAGDYFEYRSIDDPGKKYGIESSLIFRIETRTPESFSVRRASKAVGQNGAQQLMENPNRDIIYDNFGRIIATADTKGPGKNKGRFSNLWLSPNKRKAGSKLKTEGYFKKEAAISGPQTWNGWTVWVAEFANYKRYYDQDTGFLVGWTDSVRPMKLIASNRIPGPLPN